MARVNTGKGSSVKNSKSSKTTKTSKSSKTSRPRGFRYANRLASAAINTTVRDLGNKANSINRDYQSAANEANTGYQRAVGDLNYLYGESGRYIGNANSKMDTDFNNARSQVTAAGAALQQQIAASSKQRVANLNNELNRLGANASGLLDGLNADQQYASMTAAQNTANNDANLGLMQSGSRSVGDLLLGMNKGSQTSNLGQALNARNDALAEAARTRNNQLAAINDSINSAKAGRSDLIVQILDQMRQSGWFKSSSSSGRSGGSSRSFGGSGSGSTSTAAGTSLLNSFLGSPQPKKPKKKRIGIPPRNKFDLDGHPGIDY